MYRTLACIALLCLFDADAATARQDAFTVNVSYTADLAKALHGGLRDRVAFLDNADVILLADLEKLLVWSGASLLFYGLGNQGSSASDLVGDLQGVDNIEAPVAWRIYEAFLEKRFASDRASVLVGVYDLNSEFDVEPAAGLFVNSSFGVGAEYAASREYGPSIFPETSLGARFRFLPRDWWYVQAAVLDGLPGDPNDPAAHPFEFKKNDGVLIAGETAVILDSKRVDAQARRRRVSRADTVPYRAKVGVGAWYYTARFDRIDGTRRPGNVGAYLMSQYRIYAEPGDVNQGLRGFARVGFADWRVNRIAGFTGFGLVYAGLIPGRNTDELGLGTVIAYHGSPWQRAARRTGSPVERSEATVETTYLAVLSGWLSVQADIQWIIHPDMDPKRRSAVFGALRIITSF